MLGRFVAGRLLLALWAVGFLGCGGGSGGGPEAGSGGQPGQTADGGAGTGGGGASGGGGTGGDTGAAGQGGASTDGGSAGGASGAGGVIDGGGTGGAGGAIGAGGGAGGAAGSVGAGGSVGGGGGATGAGGAVGVGGGAGGSVGGAGGSAGGAGGSAGGAGGTGGDVGGAGGAAGTGGAGGDIGAGGTAGGAGGVAGTGGTGGDNGGGGTGGVAGTGGDNGSGGTGGIVGTGGTGGDAGGGAGGGFAGAGGAAGGQGGGGGSVASGGGAGGSGGAGGAPPAPALLAISDGPTFDFGGQPIGSVAEHTFTVTNTGGTAAQALAPAAAAPGPFAFKGGTYPGTAGSCGATLGPQASCTLVVTFAPVGSGAATRTLALGYFDGATTQSATVSIAGTGLAPALLAFAEAPSFDFGTLASGASADRTLVLTNSGAVTATALSGGALSGSLTYKGGTYPGSGANCGTTLVPGASCTIVVTFAPVASGAVSKTLSVGYSDGVSSQTAALGLSGTGAAPALLVFADAPGYDYGTVADGGTAERAIVVQNSGGVAATALAASALGNAFSYKGGVYPGTAGSCGATLNPGASCTVVVTFAPTSAVTFSKSLTIGYNDGVTAQVASLALSGKGAAPAVLAFTGGPFAYGTRATGSSTDQTLTVINSGGFAGTTVGASGLGGALAFKGATYPGSGGTCGATLAAGASCTIVVTFAPVSAGAVSATLTLGYFDGAANKSATASLSGTGAAPALLAFTEAPSFDFGPRAAGSTTDHTLTLGNSGGVPATALAAGALGGGLAYKAGTYPGGGGTCGATLAAGASCTIIVTFAPVASGVVSKTLSVGYSDGASSQSAAIALAGTGAAPALLLFADAPGYDYGTVAVGATAERALSVHNNGGVGAAALAAGALGSGFAYKGGAYPGTAGSCGATLAAGASCTIVVTFTPASSATFSKALALGYDDGAAAQAASLPLSGKGATPASLNFSAASYPYGTHPNGSSTDQTLTVSNSGGVAATALTATGLAGTVFAFKGGSYPGTGGNCAATLSAGASCTLVVTFTPTGTGSASATLTLSYANGATTQTTAASLAGVGTPPASLAVSDAVTYDFGALATGTHTNHIFYVSNTGSVAATALAGAALSTPFSYAGGAFPGTGGSCTAVLAAGATCAVNVAFGPVAAVTSMTTLSVAYDDGVTARTATRPLTGAGTNLAVLVISDFPPDYYHTYGLPPDAATFDYGAHGVGSSTPHTFYITNTGAVAATSISGGPLGAPFNFTGASCGSSIAAGVTCTVTVAFAPTAVAASSATLGATYNDGATTKALSRPLSGSGTNAPVLVIQDFGGVNLGASWDYGTRGIGVPGEHMFVVSNTGGAPAATITASAPGTGFGYKGGSYPGTGGSCGTTLAAGATCNIVVVFMPVAVGAATGTITLGYTDATAAPYTASRAVKGVGTDKGLLEIDDTHNGPITDYGSIAVGSASAQTFIVTNIGAATVSAMSFASLASPYRFAGGSYPGTGGTCATTLAMNTSCTVTVTFTPLAGGIFNATLQATYNDSAATQTAGRSLVGRGVDGALLAISPWSGGGGNPIYDYGTSGVPVDHTFFITNSGPKAAVSVTGLAPSPPFAWKGGTFPGSGGTCSATLGAGASCTVVVTYAATSSAGGTFGLRYGDGNGNTVSASQDVTGTAISTAYLVVTDCNQCGVNQGPEDFGTVGAATQRTLWIVNNGSKKATALADGHTLGSGFSFAGGAYPGTVSGSQPGTCGTTLDPGASCSVIVNFTPPGTGVFSTTLTVAYDDGTGVVSAATRALTATGTNLAILTVRDWSQTSTSGGGAFDYGTAGAPMDHTFYLTNDGAQSATVMANGGTLGSGGFNWKGGTYPGTGGTCAATLAAGGYCTVVVTFTPSGTGTRTGALSVSYFDGSGTQAATRALSATATDAALLQVADWNGGASPSGSPPFDYGTWGAAVDHTFTITNSGAQSATMMADGATLGGGFGWKGGVVFGGGTCGATLGVGASCTVVVTFTPSGSGARSSTLSVSYFDGHGTQAATRSLTGTAVAQALLRIYDWSGAVGQFIPQSPFDYGTWGVSVDQTFTVSNDGGAQATSMGDGGFMGGGFAWKGGPYPGTGGTCAATLNAGATCTVVVTYSPGGTVSQSGHAVIDYFDGAFAQSASRGVMGTPTSHANLVVSEFFGTNPCNNCGPWDFGTVALGNSAEHTFTIFNTGALDATPVSGSSLVAAPFAFKGGSYPGTGGTCGTTVASGANCTVIVTFTPTAVTTSTGTVGVQYSDSTSTPLAASRAVQGTGH